MVGVIGALVTGLFRDLFTGLSCEQVTGLFRYLVTGLPCDLVADRPVVGVLDKLAVTLALEHLTGGVVDRGGVS